MKKILKQNWYKAIIIFCIVFYSIAPKAEATLSAVCVNSTGPTEPPIQQMQIQIQGIATTNDGPLPIGTKISYSAAINNFPCGAQGSRVGGDFIIDKADGQYGPLTISVPVSDSFYYFNLTIPQGYIEGKIIKGDKSLNFTITSDMSGKTLTQNLAFKINLVIPPPPPPPLPPPTPQYPLLGNPIPTVISTPEPTSTPVIVSTTSETLNPTPAPIITPTPVSIPVQASNPIPTQYPLPTIPTYASVSNDQKCKGISSNLSYNPTTNLCECSSGYNYDPNTSSCVVAPVASIKSQDKLCKDIYGPNSVDSHDKNYCKCDIGYQLNQNKTQCVPIPVKINNQKMAVNPTIKNTTIEIKEIKAKATTSDSILIKSTSTDVNKNIGTTTVKTEVKSKNFWSIIKNWFGFK